MGLYNLIHFLMRLSLYARTFTFILALISSTAFAQLPGSGNAYDFNFNYASVPHNTALDATSALTIEAWIKADSWAANIWQNVIVSKDGWQFGEQGYTLRCGDNGRLSFNIGTPGAWIEATTGSVMIPGEWYHVAGVYDGQYLKTYVNGVVQDSTAFSGSISTSTYDLTIGRISYTAGGTRDFDGMIDEVRIWTSAVSQQELRDYMCRKVTSGHPDYATLAAYYNMDETTGTTLVDQGPNALNGTLVGPTRVTSAAPIGDASTYWYGTPASLALTTATDTAVCDLAGNSTQMHLYRVDMASNDPVAPVGYDTIGQSHYYGVWAPLSGALAFTVTYHYGTNPLVAGANEPLADLAERVDNSSTPWTGANATLDMNANTLSKSYLQRQEFILALEACPVASLNQSGPQVLCGSATLTVTEQTGGWTTYQWLDNGAPIGGATNASYDITSAGNYSLVVSNGICVDTTAGIAVTVASLPTVSFGTLGATHCDNDADATITGGSPATGTYSGTGISGSDFSPSTAGAGTPTLYYSYTDTNGCTGVDSMVVTVFAAPSVSFSNLADACENDAAFALSGATPAGGTYSGTGVSGGSFDPTTAGLGTHTITYDYTDGNGCSDQGTATITVNAQPAAATISQNGADMCATAGANSVVWVDANGTPIAGATNSCYTATADGMYGVVLTSPDGCTSDTTWYDMTHFGFEEPLWAQQISIAPNPTSDVLFITYSGLEQRFDIQLLDVQGRVIATQQYTGKTSSLDLEGLDSGVYLLQISNAEGRAIKRVVKH